MTRQLTFAEFKTEIFNPEHNKEWVFKGTRPVLIDFYADWCGPCKALSPIIDKLSQEFLGQIDIYKVDTDEEQELSQLFNISSIPSLLFIPIHGQPSISRGAMPEKSLRKAFSELFELNP